MQANRGIGRQQSGKPHKKQMFCQQCRRSCPAGLTYLGNIFLLGMATLVSELVDLQAGSALEVLLEPFRNENGSNLEQDSRDYPAYAGWAQVIDNQARYV